MKDVYIENNTFMYNGYGWAYDHREPHKKRGASFFSWTYNGAASNIFVRNNIFYKDRAPSFYIWDARNNKWKTTIICDRNLYFDGSPDTASEGEKAIWFADYSPTSDGNWITESAANLYSPTEWQQWKSLTGGFDATSLVEVNPQFIKNITIENIDSEIDFTLNEKSTAIGSGLYLSKYANQEDIWGNIPGQNFNIGAYNGGVVSSNKDNFSDKLKIYPNPFKKAFNLNINSNAYKIEIYNTNGIKVLTKNISNISSIRINELSSCPSGVYFGKVFCNNDFRMFELVKY